MNIVISVVLYLTRLEEVQVYIHGKSSSVANMH